MDEAGNAQTAVALSFQFGQSSSFLSKTSCTLFYSVGCVGFQEWISQSKVNQQVKSTETLLIMTWLLI